MATLLFFGRLGDMAGGVEREFSLPEPETKLKTILDVLNREDLVLGAALRDPSTRIAVNGEIVTEMGCIKDCDEIAFMPPFSGG